MATHRKEGKELATAGLGDRPSWAECALQTYFIGKGRIDYFVVVEPEDEKEGSGQQGPIPVTEPQKAYLEGLEKDIVEGVKEDIAKQADIV